MNTDFRAVGRRLRAHYDSAAFGPGPRAELRREKSASALRLEGHFLALAERAKVDPKDLDRAAALVWLFPAAEARSSSDTASRFSLGSYLRRELFDEVSAEELPVRARRFRQMLAARDESERLHHLRRLLSHAYLKNRRGVDWGVIAADLAYFNDETRRRWTEAFFYRFSDVVNAQEVSHG